MKRTIDEHAERFDGKASDYDENETPEYRACRDLVIERADPRTDDIVLDIGTGTGAIALALAPMVERVVGRDISVGMLEQAKRKATEAEASNLEFDLGRFLEPNYEGEASLITSNFAMHHLDDERKAEAIDVLLDHFAPRRFVLGDVMFFGIVDGGTPFYDPDVDDPAPVGLLVEAITDAGYAVVDATSVHNQVGVLTAEPIAR